MTKPIIHDGYEQREMTAAEYTEWQELTAEVQAQAQAAADAIAAQIAAKESAKAKLAALGLTEEEVSALLG